MREFDDVNDQPSDLDEVATLTPEAARAAFGEGAAARAFGGVAARTDALQAGFAEPSARAPELAPAVTAGLPEYERRRRWRRRLRHNRHLRDVLTAPQRSVLLGLALLWAVSTAWAIRWWLEPGHEVTTLRLVLNSIPLTLELVLLPLWFYWSLWRIKRPDPELGVPALRTAIIVTKAPSEPWPVVRQTLEAMLAQDFPHPYDVWLADESVTPVTRAWCEERGVRISSREGIAAYHRPTWPRRTKCKEGNLAYFYDTWGYENYDVVSQLDADHVPARDYLRHMVTPFVDDHVGYVAAPSICDVGSERSWAARGRLYFEAVVHGPMQASYNGGYAPSCIGSHYAVRTAALKEIGGIGPELAEDFTTTLMMNAYGWQGVFAIDAEAHGEGPECAEDFFRQEFQWSRSMVNVLLGINAAWRGVGLRARLRLGFCELWYPVYAIVMLMSVVMPLAAVLTRTPLVQVPLGEFYLHLAPAVATIVLTIVWLRLVGCLRPRDAKAMSWELVLFQITRWPWVLKGCVHSFGGWLAGRELGFKVTPKGRTGLLPLPLGTVAPFLVIAVASALPTLVDYDSGAAAGYETLALLNAGLYLGAAIAIVALHVREHGVGSRVAALRVVAPKAAVTALCASVLVLGVGMQGLPERPGPVVARSDTPYPVAGLTARDPQLGVTTRALAENATTAWGAADLAEVNAFEQMARAHAGIVQWFADWEHSALDLAQLRAVRARGSVPQITWEPWDHAGGTRQPRYTLASIFGGGHDAYIRAWARGLRRYDGPVLLRFAQEMNGEVYPWAEKMNGNRAGEYVRAWRHVHDIFTAEGADNVKWVWAPVTGYVLSSQYPGDAYVDVVGMSGFNGGTELHWSGWRSFADAFGGGLWLMRRLAPGKPVQISEVATAAEGGSKPLWIEQMFEFVERNVWIRSVVWFDVPKQADWRVATSPAAERAFVDGVARMQGRVAGVAAGAPAAG